MDGKRHWWWERVFVYAGRMAADKGVETILLAWQELRDRYENRCPPIWLVGGMPVEVEQIRTKLKNDINLIQHERTGKICWWCYLDHIGISTIFTRALTLISHSRYEPGGRVVLEAMAEGVPVIATPHGFAKDLITNWINGFLVPFGDAETLARRMEYFIHQPLLRNVLGSAAQSTVQNALNNWNFLDTHCAVYDLASGVKDIPLLQREASDEITVNYCARRRITPTFPYNIKEPTRDQVVNFTELSLDRSVSSIHHHSGDSGSSVRWLIECEDKTVWIAKWPYPRLNISVLWDPLRREPLLRPETERFESELFSGEFEGIAPWTAHNKGLNLLLRPYLQSLKLSFKIDSFVAIANTVRKIETKPVPDEGQWISTKLDKNWSWATMDEVKKINTQLTKYLKNRSAPWDPYRETSLRLGWRSIELGIASKETPLTKKWLTENRKRLASFSELAQYESKFPVVISHGSADFTHCVYLESGSIAMIDGEHIHPAWPGEDMAAVITCAFDDAKSEVTEEYLWRKILEAVAGSEEERQLIISWSAFLTLHSLCKSNIMLKAKGFSRYQKRWELLYDLIN